MNFGCRDLNPSNHERHADPFWNGCGLPDWATMEKAVFITSSLAKPKPISLISTPYRWSLASSSAVRTVWGPGLQFNSRLDGRLPVCAVIRACGKPFPRPTGTLQHVETHWRRLSLRWGVYMLYPFNKLRTNVLCTNVYLRGGVHSTVVCISYVSFLAWLTTRSLPKTIVFVSLLKVEVLAADIIHRTWEKVYNAATVGLT